MTNLEKCKKEKNTFMFDVESIGLYGAGFAFSAVVADKKGKIIDSASYSCLTEEVIKELNKLEFFTTGEGKEIITECKKLNQVNSLKELRNKFYNFYMKYKDNCDIYSDCNYPVETNFLADVANDDLEIRQWNMPFPLLDVVHKVSPEVDRVEYYTRKNAYYILQDVANRKPIKHNPYWDCVCSLYLLIN